MSDNDTSSGTTGRPTPGHESAATARVPPTGYHTPSLACMSPMEASTAGAR